jgi:hypothetical protein
MYSTRARGTCMAGARAHARTGIGRHSARDGRVSAAVACVPRAHGASVRCIAHSRLQCLLIQRAAVRQYGGTAGHDKLHTMDGGPNPCPPACMYVPLERPHNAGPHESANPGAGAVCEGEDFVAVNSIAGMEVATAHVYERCGMAGVRARTPYVQRACKGCC